MKKFPWLPIIGIGVAAWYLISRTNVAKNFKTVLRKVKIGGKILSPKFYLTFGIQNPTSGSANIRSIMGSVLLNGNVIADVSSFTLVKIQPFSESMYQVTVEPQKFGILSEVKSIIKEGIKSVNIEFNGTLNVDGNSFPIKTSYRI